MSAQGHRTSTAVFTKFQENKMENGNDLFSYREILTALSLYIQQSRFHFVMLWLLDFLIVKQEVCCVEVLFISPSYQS